MIFVALIVLIAVIAAAVQLKRRGYFGGSKESTPAPVTTTLPFPCIVEGTFHHPAREAAIAARNASLYAHGHTVPADDNPDDNGSFANTVLGGGTPYGGVYQAGALYFDIDANGQAKPNSWISSHGPDKFPVTGGIEASGKVGMASVGGLTIAGMVRDGIATLVISESGRSVDTDPARHDTVWAALSPVDKQNLNGNRFGSIIEYVYGVSNVTFRKV